MFKVEANPIERYSAGSGLSSSSSPFRLPAGISFFALTTTDEDVTTCRSRQRSAAASFFVLPCDV